MPLNIAESPGNTPTADASLEVVAGGARTVKDLGPRYTTQTGTNGKRWSGDGGV